jgi:hypothetical protein
MGKESASRRLLGTRIVDRDRQRMEMEAGTLAPGHRRPAAIISMTSGIHNERQRSEWARNAGIRPWRTRLLYEMLLWPLPSKLVQKALMNRGSIRDDPRSAIVFQKVLA